MNATAMEALPIFLDAIVPSAYAILISVVLVLIFGEVLPQAICTGKQQLTIAEYSATMVKLLMWLTVFVTKPMALMLDYILGVHGSKTRFKNDQLKQLIKMHSDQALTKVEGHFTADFGLSNTQTKIIEGAFELS